MAIPGVLMCLLFAIQQDPFQELDRKPAPAPAAGVQGGGFFEDNFTFKKELYSQFSHGSEEPNDGNTLAGDVYSRQSAGFEVLKKFSTATSTVASFNMQGRAVHRTQFVETISDMEGEDRDGWFFEYHNLYVDLYNVFDPFLSAEGRGENLGRFNLRVGRFYLPFGLNLQTDTHGTLLQLSNDRNFGYERDWYAGFWGSLTPDLNYDAYYLLGSGYAVSFKGQEGLAGLRVSLADRYRTEYGVEAGIAAMYGRRLSEQAVMRSPSVAATAGEDDVVSTVRAGLDARYTLPLPSGSLGFTAELSYGRDEFDAILTQLYQIEYLADRRRWALSAQYRRFWQDIDASGHKTDASIIGEATWFFRNDPSNAFLHSVRLNVERRLERQTGPDETVVSLQYYLYW